jgi:hypothetical protein
LVAVSDASWEWQLVQSASRSFGGSKSCSLWQLVQTTPPACAPLSVLATFAWQLVQVFTLVVAASP